MRRHVSVLLLSIASLLGASAASAQQSRSIGLTMGYPASVGLLWHMSEAVAVRPDVAFVHSTSEIETSSPIVIVGGPSSGNAFQVGLSALFYFARWDMLRAYVVPRYAYYRSTSSNDITATGHSGAVSFGAQYALGERFAAFGELGLSYDRLTNDQGLFTYRNSSFGTRSGLGMVVYF